MSQQHILLVIILSYFALLLGVAFYTARGSNNESFFVGNRSSKWWLVAFGMIGTSLSGMTFISVPGKVGGSAFDYFQVTIGYWLGYFIVAYVLLPVYYKMQLTSIYTYLEKRLGVNAHKTGAFFFILSRTLGATIRLYLVINVLETYVLQELNISFEITAIVILGLILLYTFKGGVKTIVWTDTLQTTFMLLGLLISLFYISDKLGFSITEAWQTISHKGMTKIFSTNPLPENFFLKQILGGAFVTIAMTGLDQEMMQKNISVSNLKDSQKNMLVMGTMQMLVVFVFLFLGGMLTVYAQQYGMAVSKGDQLFPTIALQGKFPFIITICFVIGLISALFPSADGALTALTSSFCIDILGMKMGKHGAKIEGDSLREEKKKTKTRLIVHCSFAVVFLFCIFFFREIDNGSLIDLLLKLAGFTYGPLLGLFAFGILTKRKLKGNISFIICIVAMLMTLVIDVINNYDKYMSKFSFSPETNQSLTNLSASIFGGYKIGVELLIINAALTFLFLFIFSKKSTEKTLETIPGLQNSTIN